MRRTFLLPLIAVSVVCISAPAREIAPFRTAQSPPGKESPRDSRGKIIDEIRADYDDVVNEFAKKNVNEQMRAKQQRIIDNLKRLLEDDDPPPPPNGSAKPDNSPQKSPPPRGSQANPPAPKPNPRMAPAREPKDAQDNPPEPNKPLPGKNGANVSPPRTIEELQKRNATPGFMELPPHQREAIDAHARDRFPPRYEELLRAYYRTIAAGARRGAEE